MKSEPRVAFIIDALPSLGGGEKVLFTALEIFPKADIFTLVYDRTIFAGTPLTNKVVKTSFINSLPLARKHHRLFLPLMPAAVERFDLCDYDTVVCFSYAVAHGVKKYNGAQHISYTYTPMRYAWTDININGTRARKNILLDGLMHIFRNWDKRAAARVHAFASISQAVSKRIMDSYQRTAPVIYPPVEVENFHPNKTRDNFYITVSRLVPHKRVDILIQAFSRLKLSLYIVGIGPEFQKLKAMSNSNIHFLGYQSDEQVAELLGKAHGFVCAAEEDFGIAIVEAQAAGCPVIAYGSGGALETVLDGVTGILFTEQSVQSLTKAVIEFENKYPGFRSDAIRRNAIRFNKARFKSEFKEFVESKT